MPTWDVIGRFRPTRFGLHTRIHRLREAEEGIPVQGEVNVLDVERNCFHKLYSIL
jgi:hypothetical protein